MKNLTLKTQEQYDEYLNNHTWCVYLHTVPKEITNYERNKYYVGITVYDNPEKRWQNGNGYKTQLFGKAISKYGWDNIIHEVLYKNLSYEDALIKEHELMYKYNSLNPEYGYNVQDTYNETKDGRLPSFSTPDTNYNATPVICLNTLEHFNTMTEAANVYNTSVAHISRCCKGEKYSAGLVPNTNDRAMWEIYDENKQYKKITYYERYGNSTKRGRMVINVQLNLVFPTLASAGRYYNCDPAYISDCCYGKINNGNVGILDSGELIHWEFFDEYLISHNMSFDTYDKSLFTFIKDEKPHYRNTELANDPESGKIICLNTKKIYNSISDACNELNLNRTVIGRNCVGKATYCGIDEYGYRLIWMFYNDYLKLSEQEINEKFIIAEKSRGNFKREIICYEDNNLFSCAKECSIFYDIPKSTISQMALKNNKFIYLDTYSKLNKLKLSEARDRFFFIA